MADHESPGDKLSARLAARAARGLQRKSMPDGGEVYTGPLASRALKAVGARAMTMDESVIVDQSFDASTKAEDAALYAHEQVHMMGSGGEGTMASRDSEEVAARSVERMVLHRAQAGEDVGSIMRDVKGGGKGGGKGKGGESHGKGGKSGGGKGGSSAKGGGGKGGGKGAGKGGGKGGGGKGKGGGESLKAGGGSRPGSSKDGNGKAAEDEATAAYAAMIAAGKTHEQIVSELTHYVLDAIQQSEASNMLRVTPSRSI